MNDSNKDTTEKTITQGKDAANSDQPIIMDEIITRKLARAIIFGRAMDDEMTARALVVVMDWMKEADANARFDFYNYFLAELAPYLPGYGNMIREISDSTIREIHAQAYGER